MFKYKMHKYYEGKVDCEHTSGWLACHCVGLCERWEPRTRSFPGSDREDGPSRHARSAGGRGWRGFKPNVECEEKNSAK